MKDSEPNSSHPPETLIAAYAIGKCSPEIQAEINDHCFTCESCRTRLSILLRLSSLEGNEFERSELERLFPLGKETIAQARQPIGSFPHSTKESHTFSSTDHTKQSNKQLSRSIWGKNFYRVAAISVILAIAFGVGYSWYTKYQSPVRNSLLAMQRSYQQSRPLEARLSGGLDYRPYARTRGDLENADINRDQLNYALAELTRVVATTSTPQERHALGRLYLFLGEFDKAETQMKLALDTLKRDAKLHTDLATLYYERSNYSDSDPSSLLFQAINHYKLAIEIEPLSVEAWFNKALCHEKLSLFSLAKEDWEQYLRIDSTSKWAEEARERLKKIEARSSNSSDSKKKETTADLIERAMSGDNKSLLSALEQNPVIVTQYAINDLLEQYLAASLNDKPEQAEPILLQLKRIGQVISETKKDNFVLDLADFAARASPKMKSGILNVHLKLRQADKEFSRSSHDRAFKFYQSSLIAAKYIGDELHAEIAASNLVRYSHNRANSHSLISLGKRLITQTEKQHHRQVQAITHAALANAYLASQQGTLALENSLRAVAIAKEIGDRDTLINALILAGSAYTRSGNYALGISKSFEVLSILNNYPTSRLRSFQAYQQLWEPLFRLGNYKLALDYQKEALHTVTLLDYTPGIIGTLGRIGLNQWKLDHKVEAENYLKDAIVKCNTIADKTLRQLLQTELYTALGDVLLSLGKTKESLTSYSSGLDTIKASNNSVYLSAIHQGLASAYLAQNEFVAAEGELQKSISLLEKSRQKIYDANGRSVFLSRSQNAYKAMIDFQYYIKRNENLAFDYAEVARNRNVLDAIAGSPSLKKSDGITVLSVSNNSNPLTLKEVQKRMPATAQLLAYALTEKGLIIWLVTSDSMHSAHVEVSAKDLEEGINDYAAKLRKREDIHLINRKSSQLFNILILPVLNRLDGHRPLYIVQDGILSQLPFSSLYSSSTNRYVVEDYSIVTNHSASIFIKTHEWATSQQNDNDESFLGVSNPRFSYNRFHGLRSLPSAEDEINKIGALYERSVTFSRDKATESVITQKIRNYNVIHIATHTLNYEADNLATTILLAEESSPNLKNKSWKGITYDGTFQASEVYNLKLPEAKIVILSSCRSGLGNATNGEATGALAQAFLAIRVPTVVASLWDIDDEISSDFMYLVHQNHRVKSLSFAESIRQVQHAFINGTDGAKHHPYYWAAFQILGDGSR